MRYLFGFMFCVAQAATLVAVGHRHALAAPPRAWAGGVTISLRPSCDVDGEAVLISHVARVDSTDTALKSRIEALDLVDVPSHGGSVAVSPKLVEFRLRLAGIDTRSITIRGSQTDVTALESSIRPAIERTPALAERASEIHATAYSRSTMDRLDAARSAFDGGKTQPRDPAPAATAQNHEGKSMEDIVLAVARQAVLDRLPWNEEDVTFRLVQPISREVKQAETTDEYTCTADLRATGPPVGRVNIDVTVKFKDQATVEIPVAFDVRHYDMVVSTSRPIARGRKIQKEDLYLHRWDVTGALDYSTQPDQLIGRVVNRALPAVQIVRDQDLERVAGNQTGPDRPVMIKRSDRVKLVAKIGDLSITVAGEAMQDGKIGDTIRVQNVESKSIIQGRVLSADEVEIAKE